MAAKISVLGVILSFYPYLRSAMLRFPLSKGPAIKKLMPLVVIIEAHDALRNFWIW